jgi:hypothetical protein
MAPRFGGAPFSLEKYPEEKKKRNMTFAAAPGDEKTLGEIMTALGIGQSEAIRTSIRVYAALLRARGK